MTGGLLQACVLYYMYIWSTNRRPRADIINLTALNIITILYYYFFIYFEVRQFVGTKQTVSMCSSYAFRLIADGMCSPNILYLVEQNLYF